jgi:hypothetical protein
MLEAERVFAVLAETGAFTDPSAISRVVIDARRGRYAVLHVERIADEQVLDVARSLAGPMITEPEPEPAGEHLATVTSLPGPEEGEDRRWVRTFASAGDGRSVIATVFDGATGKDTQVRISRGELEAMLAAVTP